MGSAVQAVTAGCAVCRVWRLIEVDAKLEDMAPHQDRLLRLLDPAATVMDLNIGTALWCVQPALESTHPGAIFETHP